MSKNRIPPELLARARELRKNLTKPEVFLWNKMRSWSSQGVHIRRQHIISTYIVDFAHLPTKTAIEVDGMSHAGAEQYDLARSTIISNLGWKIVRVGNDEILQNSDNVAISIAQLLCHRGAAFTKNFVDPTDHPSHEGEGQGWGDSNPETIKPISTDHPSPGGEGQGWRDGVSSLLNHPAIREITEKTKTTTYKNNLYIVGGAVRDALLNREPKNDLDIVTELDAQSLAKLLDQKAHIYPRFGTAMIRIANTNVELVTARKESYNATSRKPYTEPATLLDDALRRDFTCNTLLLNLHTGELIDLLGTGIIDLQNKILRTPLDPAETFHDDPLRMLRAVRFKHQLGFEYSEKLSEALTQESHRLSIISQERIRDEFTKSLLGPNPDIALQELLDFGLLNSWAPELKALVGVEQGKWHYADVWTHTLHVVKNVTSHSEKISILPESDSAKEGREEPISKNPDGENTPTTLPLGEGLREGQNTQSDLTLILAALLHDIAKPQTRSIDEKGDTRFFNHERVGAELAHTLCIRWRFSQETARDVSLLVKNHMRLSGIKKLSTPATRRIIRDLGEQLQNWIALIDADANALKKGVRKLDLRELKTKIAEVQSTQPKLNWASPLNGEQIMKITGLPPGPDIGKIKAQLEELVIEGKIPPDDQESAKDALQNIIRNRPSK